MKRRFQIPCQVQWAHGFDPRCQASFMALSIDASAGVNWAYFVCSDCASNAEKLPALWNIKPLPAEWLVGVDE